MSATHEEVLRFSNEQKLGVLSTSSEKGEVWGAAIYYIVDEQFNFYFLTRQESQKYHNLKKHPQAALTVTDDYKQMTVQLSGKVSEVLAEEERSTLYRKLALVHPPGQFSWVPPVSKIHDEGPATLLKLTPAILHFSSFKPESRSPGGYVTRII